MKKMSLLLFCLIFSFPLHAQEKTLVGEDIDNGGFGAPVLKFTGVNGEGKVMTGARGGWIMNHQFVLGGGSYSVVNESRTNGTAFDVDYSGLELEYIAKPVDLIHYSVYLLIGGGDIRERKDDALNSVLDSDGIFVVAPEVNVLLNITEHFHVGAGLGYRWVNGVEILGLANNDVRGMSASLTFKFGSF